jgi:hypothetical protein
MRIERHHGGCVVLNSQEAIGRCRDTSQCKLGSLGAASMALVGCRLYHISGLLVACFLRTTYLVCRIKSLVEYSDRFSPKNDSLPHTKNMFLATVLTGQAERPKETGHTKYQ